MDDRQELDFAIWVPFRVLHFIFMEKDIIMVLIFNSFDDISLAFDTMLDFMLILGFL